MDSPERFEQAQSVSEDISHATTEPPTPEEDYNRVDISYPKEKNQQSRTSKISSRIRSLAGKAKDKAQTWQQQYPKAAKYGGYAAKGVKGVASLTPLGRGAKIAAHAPEAYQYGKQVWHFIKEAKLTQAAEEKAARGKAFHEVAVKQRGKEIRSLEKQLHHAYSSGKGEKPALLDEVRWSNQAEIDDLTRKIEQARHKGPSLEEVLSKKADHPQFNNGLEQSRAIADEYRKTLMSGTAQDKYHYLLDQTRRELGDNYYDVAKHPQRSVQFDQFASQRLFMDGFDQKSVQQAIEKGAIYPSFKKQVQHQGQKLEILDPATDGQAKEYLQRTIGSLDERHAKLHNQMRNWQQSQAKELRDIKINPEEIKDFKQLQQAAETYRLAKTKESQELAQQTLRAYKADNAQWHDSPTTTEYLLEMGRRIEAGKAPNTKSVATKLVQAGHEEKYIVGTLRELNPEMNNSQRLSERFMKDLTAENQQQTSFGEKMQSVQDFKSKNSIPEKETRLDRLQLSYDQVEGKMKEETFHDTTKEIMQNTSRSGREIEEIDR